MQRPIPLALCLLVLGAGLPSCSGLEPEEQQMLVVHKQLSKTYYDRGDFGRAEQQCRLGLETDSSDRTLLLTLAWVRLRQGTKEALAEAEDLFNRLGGPRSDDFRVHLGRALVFIAHFRNTPEDAPADAQEEARDYLKLARKTLDKVLTLAPDCTEAAYQAAVLSLEEEDFAAFETLSDRTLVLVERSIKAKDLALERIDRPEQQALVKRDRWLDASRGRELLLLRAQRAYEDGQLDASLAHLDRLGSMGEMGPADYFNRARILEDLHQWERAAKDYERFIVLNKDPSSTQVQAALDNLEVIRARIAETRTADGVSGR